MNASLICIFHFAYLVSARVTVFQNRTRHLITIKVYAEDPKSKKLILRDELSFILQPQRSVRKKISNFCFQEVNPERQGVLIAYLNGKQVRIPGHSLRTTAAFVFDHGEDERVFVQPVKECSTELSRLRMFACIGRRSDDGRRLPPIKFEQGNPTERTSFAHHDPVPQVESEADETESPSSA